MRTLKCILCSALVVLTVEAARAQDASSRLQRKEPIMTRHASGPFEVKTTPLPGDEVTGGTLIGRYSLVKQFHGDLEATSKGEMLGAGDPSSGNAGYVAIEEVTGTLNGHKGRFALQHIGVMEHGGYKLSVVVVPGSGSGELAGLSGTMTIKNDAGKHSYEFEYTLAAAAQ